MSVRDIRYASHFAFGVGASEKERVLASKKPRWHGDGLSLPVSKYSNKNVSESQLFVEESSHLPSKRYFAKRKASFKPQSFRPNKVQTVIPMICINQELHVCDKVAKASICQAHPRPFLTFVVWDYHNQVGGPVDSSLFLNTTSQSSGLASRNIMDHRCWFRCTISPVPPKTDSLGKSSCV